LSSIERASVEPWLRGPAGTGPLPERPLHRPR
jgi:hypothetical protein